MYVVQSDRRGLIELLPPVERAAEIGVYRGDWTGFLLRLTSKRLYLIDPWSEVVAKTFLPQDRLPDAEHHLAEALRSYYPEGIAASIANAEAQVQARYAHDDRVRILKGTSADICSGFDDGVLDLIYIDGNHQLDFVKADLLRWRSKLKPKTGCFVLNDFYRAQAGEAQFLGVVEAASTFMALYDFKPIAMTGVPFGNLWIAQPEAADLLRRYALAGLIQRDLGFFEIPDHCAMSVRHLTSEAGGRTREYLSFGR